MKQLFGNDIVKKNKIYIKDTENYCYTFFNKNIYKIEYDFID